MIIVISSLSLSFCVCACPVFYIYIDSTHILSSSLSRLSFFFCSIFFSSYLIKKKVLCPLPIPLFSFLVWTWTLSSSLVGKDFLSLSISLSLSFFSFLRFPAHVCIFFHRNMLRFVFFVFVFVFVFFGLRRFICCWCFSLLLAFSPLPPLCTSACFLFLFLFLFSFLFFLLFVCALCPHFLPPCFIGFRYFFFLLQTPPFFWCFVVLVVVFFSQKNVQFRFFLSVVFLSVLRRVDI